MGAGVLNECWIKYLIKKTHIRNLDRRDKDIGGSAMDLHLTDQIWKMKKGSIKNSRHGVYFDTILNNIDYAERVSWDSTHQTILKKGNTYVIKIKEEFDFKGTEIHGKATTRSSIGRIDILTRLIANYIPIYDTIEKDYEGSVYLEVTPLAFNVKIDINTTLHQLRLFHGDPRLSLLTDKELHLYDYIVLEDEESGFSSRKDNIDSLDVTLKKTKIKMRKDEDEKEGVAFVSKSVDKDTLVVDLTDKSQNDYTLFWEIEPEEIIATESVKLIEKEKFYVLRSRQRLKLPPNLAGYIYAVVEEIGEWRTHYAGFVHPSFGATREYGTPVIFEVRGHNLDVVLRHREVLAKMEFYRMLEDSHLKNKTYEDQELKLSKYFT